MSRITAPRDEYNEYLADMMNLGASTNFDECRECSICKEEHVHLKLPSSCGHTFGGTCILDWLEMSNTCPMCREPLFGAENYQDLIFRQALAEAEAQRVQHRAAIEAARARVLQGPAFEADIRSVVEQLEKTAHRRTNGHRSPQALTSNSHSPSGDGSRKRQRGGRMSALVDNFAERARRRRLGMNTGADDRQIRNLSELYITNDPDTRQRIDKLVDRFAGHGPGKVVGAVAVEDSAGDEGLWRELFGES